MARGFKRGLLVCIVVLCIETDASLLDYWNSRGASETAVTAQTSNEACRFESGALETCQSAELEKGETSDYFNVCPTDGKSDGVAYNFHYGLC